MDPSLSLSIDPPSPPHPLPTAANAVTHNHIAHAANPTPAVAPTCNHPSYADMICSAIAALKEKDGSSKRAIAKYIEQVYSDLPPTHSALLSHNLKRLKDAGVLVMVKKSYKLLSSSPTSSAPSRSDLPNNNHQQAVASASSSGPKRGRGRPPKPKPESQGIILSDVQLNGQPNQYPNPDHQPAMTAFGILLEPNPPLQGSVVGKRGRGRPRKSGSVLPAKRSPMKPKKPKTLSLGSMGTGGLKRGRGRPKAQPLVGPNASLLGLSANMPKPRGRPRKVDPPATLLGGGAVQVKRRGRPPKMSGISRPMKPKRSTGKPVGRPKKNVPWGPAEAQAEAAYGELRRKLEFFQSRVMQAVGVLKHQLGNENHHAVGAIQELEGLAAMDIDIPLEQEPEQQEQQLEPEPFLHQVFQD